MRYCTEINKPPEDGKNGFLPIRPKRPIMRFNSLANLRESKAHSPHDFRYTYISNLVALVLPVSDVAVFSGDSEQTILQTYIQATEDYRLRLLDQVNTNLQTYRL